MKHQASSITETVYVKFVNFPSKHDTIHRALCSNCMTTPTTQLNNSAEGYLTSFSRELGILQVLQEILQKKTSSYHNFQKLKMYLPYLRISIRQFSDHILYQFISRFLTYECNEYLIPLKIGNQQYVHLLKIVLPMSRSLINIISNIQQTKNIFKFNFYYISHISNIQEITYNI